MIDFRQVEGRGNFYFLRHGESMGNVARIAQGQADFPLSEKGREQAAAAAAWFVDKEIDRVLCSPLSRAHQTAEIIAAELGIEDVQPRDELMEVDIGPFSGLTWDEGAQRYPVWRRQFLIHSWDGVPGAEKSDVLYGRAEDAWQVMFDLQANGSRNLLAVTHSGLLQWIIKVTMGHRTWQPLFRMRNCSIYHLQLTNGRMPPDQHVPEETPTYRFVWDFVNLCL